MQIHGTSITYSPSELLSLVTLKNDEVQVGSDSGDDAMQATLVFLSSEDHTQIEGPNLFIGRNRVVEIELIQGCSCKFGHIVNFGTLKLYDSRLEEGSGQNFYTLYAKSVVNAGTLDHDFSSISTHITNVRYFPFREELEQNLDQWNEAQHETIQRLGLRSILASSLPIDNRSIFADAP
jgi:hypothetical protein